MVTKGRVFSGEYKHITKPERELSYRVNNHGYLTVRLAGKTKMVHRLVAECFISKARKFNISSTAMSNIVRRKTYKHIK